MLLRGLVWTNWFSQRTNNSSFTLLPWTLSFHRQKADQRRFQLGCPDDNLDMTRTKLILISYYLLQVLCWWRPQQTPRKTDRYCYYPLLGEEKKSQVICQRSQSKLAPNTEPPHSRVMNRWNESQIFLSHVRNYRIPAEKGLDAFLTHMPQSAAQTSPALMQRLQARSPGCCYAREPRYGYPLPKGACKDEVSICRHLCIFFFVDGDTHLSETFNYINYTLL